MDPIAVTLLGSTGLTGAATLRSLLASPAQPFNITTLTRSAPHAPPPTNPATQHTNQLFSDLFEATKTEVAVPGSVFVSCLGTSKAAAGSVENQRRIDLDLNRDLAQKAKQDGASTAILVSAGGADAKSRIAYNQMKGQLEESIKSMDYDHVVILHPGLLLGDRKESRTGESVAQTLFRGLGKIGLPMQKASIEAADVGDCIAFYVTHPPEQKVVVVGNEMMMEAARQWRAGRGVIPVQPEIFDRRPSMSPTLSSSPPQSPFIHHSQHPQHSHSNLAPDRSRTSQ